MSTVGRPLEEPPLDGITNLRFAPRTNWLLSSSWDGTARLYDVAMFNTRGTYNAGSPLLDATFQDDSVILTGGLDGSVKRHDFFARSETVVGMHDSPVRCVEWLQERSLLATASWDRTLRLWDPRAPQGQNLAGLVGLPGKAFTMSQAGTRLVIGTSNRQVIIYDIRNIEQGCPIEARDSSLKYQTRCIRCFPDGTGYALSSVEGRVAIEYFDPSEAVQARKYAFKCHRKSEGGRDIVFPVNAIAYHPIRGTFATGGCDGVVNVWDGENKKRLCQVTGYPTSIAALAFSNDGHTLAIASSYTHEMGEREHPFDQIFLRPMADSEVTPKPRK